MTDPAVDAMIDPPQPTTPTPHAAPASWFDPMIRLAAAAKALAALAAAAEAPRPEGRPRDPRYEAAIAVYLADPEVQRLADDREAAQERRPYETARRAMAHAERCGRQVTEREEALLGAEASALAAVNAALLPDRRIPASQFRRALAGRGIPPELIVHRRHAATAGEGVVRLPGRSTTRHPSQVAREDGYLRDRQALAEAALDGEDAVKKLAERWRDQHEHNQKYLRGLRA